MRIYIRVYLDLVFKSKFVLSFSPILSLKMSSNAAASNRSNSSESGSRTAPQVITYYRDVGDEVDSHFSRALLSSSSSESHRTDSRSSGSSRSGEYYDAHPFALFLFIFLFYYYYFLFYFFFIFFFIFIDKLLLVLIKPLYLQ